jgi:hypothetical protein
MFEGPDAESKICREDDFPGRLGEPLTAPGSQNISREGEVMQLRTSLGKHGPMGGLCGAAALAIVACSAGAALAQRANDLTPSPPGAEVYFVELKDGAVVPEKFKIYFGLRNMGVARPAPIRPTPGTII